MKKKKKERKKESFENWLKRKKGEWRKIANLSASYNWYQWVSRLLAFIFILEFLSNKRKRMKQIKPIFYLEREKEELNQRKRLKLEWMASVMQQHEALGHSMYDIRANELVLVPSSTIKFGYYRVWLLPSLATTK